jgi:hypothetical protein
MDASSINSGNAAESFVFTGGTGRFVVVSRIGDVLSSQGGCAGKVRNRQLYRRWH